MKLRGLVEAPQRAFNRMFERREGWLIVVFFFTWTVTSFWKALGLRRYEEIVAIRTPAAVLGSLGITDVLYLVVSLISGQMRLALFAFLVYCVLSAARALLEVVFNGRQWA